VYVGGRKVGERKTGEAYDDPLRTISILYIGGVPGATSRPQVRYNLARYALYLLAAS